MSAIWLPIGISAGGAPRAQSRGNRIARLANRMSVRQRFLVGPLLGTILLVVLGTIFVVEMGRQKSLLGSLLEREIETYDRFVSANLTLEAEHLALHRLLKSASALAHAQIYDSATAHLENVHEAIKDMDSALSLDHNLPTPDLSEQAARIEARDRAVSYLRAATSAVTMATVEPSLVEQQLLRANDEFTGMTRAFGRILGKERAMIKVRIADQIDRIERTRSHIMLAGIASAFILLIVSQFLSKLLALSLEAQISALTALGAKAGTDMELWGANEMDRIAMSISVFDAAITKLQLHDSELEARNEALAQAMHELNAKNEELNTFSYTVSHDLRGPLRAIEGYGAALDEEYRHQLDSTASRYLDRIRAGTRRMGELIEDLLDLAKVTQAKMKVTELNLSTMAQAVVEELKQCSPDRKVGIKIAEGMTTTADEHLLRIALENLIGNAWKYSGAREDACIEIGCLRNGLTDVFFIRDNGAGFDMEYADKLFVPFQRLHSAEEFPGTGIGLATVKRIMDCHGMQVWAESQVGQGSTFYFSQGDHHG